MQSVTPRLQAGACVCAPPQFRVPTKALCFGFIARHIRGHQQRPRTCPVLPDKQRAHGEISCPNEIGMEGVLTVLTHKKQPIVRPIFLAGMATTRAGLRGIMGVNLDRHTSTQQGLVRNHALQFRKAPFGGRRVCAALLFRGLLAAFAPGPFSDVCETLQTDQTGGMGMHNAFRHAVIRVGFQPSLSSTHRHESTDSRASAFFLQTLSQSCVMVRFGHDALATMERAGSLSPKVY